MLILATSRMERRDEVVDRAQLTPDRFVLLLAEQAADLATLGERVAA